MLHTVYKSLIINIKKINQLKLDVHQDRNREAKRKRGKKQRGNEIEDEACDA